MRRLSGGERELSSVIVSSLQAAFGGVEFFLDSIDQETYDLYWRHAGGPDDAAVQDFLSRRWGNTFIFTCRESEGHTFSGQTGGVRGATSTPTAAGVTAGLDLSTPEGVSKAAALMRSLQPKSATTKTCLHCQASNPKSAKCCHACGIRFPTCVICRGLVQESEKFCMNCGWQRYHRAK